MLLFFEYPQLKGREAEINVQLLTLIWTLTTSNFA